MLLKCVVIMCREADIKFPVICSETRRHFSQYSANIMKEVDRKKQEIREIAAQLKEEEEELIKVMKKVNKLNDKYMKFLHERAPLLRDFYVGNGISSEARNNPTV